jgi:hypothetical protein
MRIETLVLAREGDSLQPQALNGCAGLRIDLAFDPDEQLVPGQTRGQRRDRGGLHAERAHERGGGAGRVFHFGRNRVDGIHLDAHGQLTARPVVEQSAPRIQRDHLLLLLASLSAHVPGAIDLQIHQPPCHASRPREHAHRKQREPPSQGRAINWLCERWRHPAPGSSAG